MFGTEVVVGDFFQLFFDSLPVGFIQTFKVARRRTP